MSSARVAGNKIILNFIWKNKETRITSTILKRRENVGEIIIPDFKIYYITTVIRNLWC